MTTKTSSKSILHKSEGELSIQALQAEIEMNTTDPSPVSAAPSITYGVHKKGVPKITQIQEYLFSRYELRYNQIANEVDYRPIGTSEYLPLNDSDLICELMEQGFKAVDQIYYHLIRSNRIQRFDPIKDYFNNLPDWSPEQPDYIEQLASFVDAKDAGWFSTQFKKMLVRTVACALGEIPFNKHCFVLVGKQNDGKTSFLRFLCPPALKNYIKEHLDFYSKDGQLALCQNFLINLDELASLSRTDINKIKSILTIDKVKERLPYDKKASVHTRRGSFLASTNKIDFLTDETGNVRWLVFEIDGIRHDNGGMEGYSKQVNIDLVYSQAYSLLKQGFPFQLTVEELAESEVQNQKFSIHSPEVELLIKYFTEDPDKKHFFTATEIAERLTEKTTLKLSPLLVGKALKYLKIPFQRQYCQKRKNTSQVYFVKSIEDSE